MSKQSDLVSVSQGSGGDPLYIDTTNDRVGIGTSSPVDTFHAVGSDGATSRTTYQNATEFVFENNGDFSIDLSTGNADQSFINWHDTDAVQQGWLSYNHNGDYMRFGVNGAERMRIDSSGGVAVANTRPTTDFDIGGRNMVIGSGSGDQGITIYSSSAGAGNIWFADGGGSTEEIVGGITYDHSGNFLKVRTNNAERMRIYSSGDISVGKTTMSLATQGASLYSNGRFYGTCSGDDIFIANRLTNDGKLLRFFQNNSEEGYVTVSGTTVSYVGGHLARMSQAANNSRVDGLLKGTVLSNLDEMCEWFRVEFEYQYLVSEVVEAKDEVLDDEGNVVEEAIAAQDAVYETRTTSEPYDGAANVGDVVDWTYEGQAVQATVIREDNEQLNRVKISDVEGDPNVAGIFVNWDDEDDINTADMNIAMTGDMIIRIAQGTTVQRGDLLMSAGDGTAKPQSDDIVRSKTIAKVISTHVTCTYDDGSYCVPCVLMAC